MASPDVIFKMQAQAILEAVGTIEGILGGDSERLDRAQHDAFGSQDGHFVSSMLIAELTRAVGRQAEQIADLKARVDELEA